MPLKIWLKEFSAPCESTLPHSIGFSVKRSKQSKILTGVDLKTRFSRVRSYNSGKGRRRTVLVMNALKICRRRGSNWVPLRLWSDHVHRSADVGEIDEEAQVEEAQGFEGLISDSLKVGKKRVFSV